ncbi:inositol-1-monophosphatase [ANME-1 cluster archaeon GoMg4]|nr:inositol-1-monophosphatase [ANME-1 cluster archaeon GoMg4]
MDIEELLEIASEIRNAIRIYLAETKDHGEVIKRRPQDVTRKIDLFAEEALENALHSRDLCARIISEELGDHVYPKGGEPEFTFIFDPIDGSTNATLGIPFFCSSIAYSPNVKHITFEDVQASVVATIYGKTYYAVKGERAWVDRIQLPREIKGKTKRAFSIYTYGANSIPDAMLQFQKGTGNMVIRVLGSIAMEICLVAEGALDAVIDVRDLVNGYDIAGASLILKEAGGIITDLEGKEFGTEVGTTHNVSLIAALKPGVRAEMLEIVSSQ